MYNINSMGNKCDTNYISRNFNNKCNNLNHNLNKDEMF